jgi:hypothetical protein
MRPRLQVRFLPVPLKQIFVNKIKKFKMTREQAKMYATIMQAYGNGKNIEIYDGTYWTIVDNPNFDGLPERYRIASEPEYEDFDCNDNLLGRVVISKDNYKIKRLITEQSETRVYVGCGCFYTYKELGLYWQFEDGSPCRKIKQ